MDNAKLCKLLFALFDAFADAVADKVADKLEKKEESTKEERNTTYTDVCQRSNSYSDTNNVLSSIPSNKDTNTDTVSLNRNSISNNDFNKNTVIVDVVNEKANNEVNENTNNEVNIPTLEDVEKYVNKCGYKMSSQKFFDYYKNNNWKTKNGVSLVGKWKGFVDTWAKAEFNSSSKPNNVGMGNGRGTVEEAHAAHPFQKTEFVVTEDGEIKLA